MSTTVQAADRVPLESTPIAHVVQRNYTAAPGTHYLLPSDDAERRRLAHQHRLLTRVMGGKLILPSIDFSRGGSVLDSGTGSGTWVLDVAQVLPTPVKLYGIDIESNLFPADDAIKFSVNSITDLPKHWENTFTLVHQRLLIAALPRLQWKAAPREIYRVLAPGGWVQLGEIGLWKGGPATERHKLMMGEVYGSKGLLIDCAAEIPSILEEAGFTDVHVENRAIAMGKWGGQNGVEMQENAIAVFRGMKTPILKAGGFGFVSSEAEYDALIDSLEKEWDEVPGTEVSFAYVWAQKPEVKSI